MVEGQQEWELDMGRGMDGGYGCGEGDIDERLNRYKRYGDGDETRENNVKRVSLQWRQ